LTVSLITKIIPGIVNTSRDEPKSINDLELAKSGHRVFMLMHCASVVDNKLFMRTSLRFDVSIIYSGDYV
jgi:hypothetical protein